MIIFLNAYKACSEIIETHAFYTEHIDLDKQYSALIITGLLKSYSAILFGANCKDFNSSVALIITGRSTSDSAKNIWNFNFYNPLGLQNRSVIFLKNATT